MVGSCHSSNNGGLLLVVRETLASKVRTTSLGSLDDDGGLDVTRDMRSTGGSQATDADCTELPRGLRSLSTKTCNSMTRISIRIDWQKASTHYSLSLDDCLAYGISDGHVTHRNGKLGRGNQYQTSGACYRLTLFSLAYSNSFRTLSPVKTPAYIIDLEDHQQALTMSRIRVRYRGRP